MTTVKNTSSSTKKTTNKGRSKTGTKPVASDATPHVHTTELQQLLRENTRRLNTLHAPFNPITGEGSVGDRQLLSIPDFPIPQQHLPKAMFHTPLVRGLRRARSLQQYITKTLQLPYNPTTRASVVKTFTRLRIRHDFPFWAALLVYIKRKGGGDDVLFRLSYPQRIIVSHFEQCRLAQQPIRLVLLKARQLGGSTLIQMYMAWLQLVHRTGLNSLIISLQSKASDEIYDMFCRMIKAYPVEMLHEAGEAYKDNEPKFVGVGVSGAIHRVPQRNCKIKLGTAEKPDSCRGGDYNLVHLSEVGLWKATEGKTPEDIVQGACSGIAYAPYTMIVYESTAKGSGNFFHREYVEAKAGRSLFSALFIPWFHIPLWSTEFASPEERTAFAQQLLLQRDSAAVESSREEPGRYLWQLWQLGATLEGIHWYIQERSTRSSHAKMSSEYPSDDIEAFTDIDSAEFDRYLVEQLRPACTAPRFIGEVVADGEEGETALNNIRFREDSRGRLWIWAHPEIDPAEIITDRYLVVVDVAKGASSKADWSVIVVFDRLYMIDGGKPAVVAQWYGRIDMDLLAWKAAQIAAYYDNALLVIESNTYESNEQGHVIVGDFSLIILNIIRDFYPNLYARRQSPDAVREGRPVHYGFHTNTSTKPMIIATLKKVIRENLYTERDERCLHEYLCYERKPNGAYGAIPGEHDDLLMTRAIGLHICFHEMDLPAIHPRHASSSHASTVISEATI